MGTGIVTAILVGALLAVPLAGAVTRGIGFTERAEGGPGDNPVPTHALSGVVKSIDATMLVVTRAGKSPHEMTFVLTRTTERQGPIRVGATVQVRFRVEGHIQVATAILATPPRQHA